MPHIYHMPKLLRVHQWGRYAVALQTQLPSTLLWHTHIQPECGLMHNAHMSQ